MPLANCPEAEKLPRRLDGTPAKDLCLRHPRLIEFNRDNHLTRLRGLIIPDCLDHPGGEFHQANTSSRACAAAATVRRCLSKPSPLTSISMCSPMGERIRSRNSVAWLIIQGLHQKIRPSSSPWV